MLEVNELRLLEALLESDEARSLHDLAQALGDEAVTLSQRLERLRATGCEVESHPQHGVRLASAGLGCWSEYLEWRHKQGPGRRVLVYARTASTQDVARQLVRGAADADDFDGYVVAADCQTAGRGRLGRVWHCSQGCGVLMSVIVARGESVDRLMLGTCHAVAQTVGRVTTGRVGVRWPNDVLVDGRKVAGILVETAGSTGRRVAIVGIGINVSESSDWPGDVRGTAAGLASMGVAPDRLRIIDMLLEELDGALNRLDDGALAASWRQHAELLGRRITVQADGRQLTGRVVDIDPEHGLLLEAEGGGVMTLAAATTTLVK
jgi:BirA family transcriptional regulator, biotin operon repressor / biotin---[acetyl-CoA-carboxylase] ligase